MRARRGARPDAGAAADAVGLAAMERHLAALAPL